MFENLDENNILLYCIKAYEKPSCIMSEFEEDMKRFNYLHRLFCRYKKYGTIKERLALNHIIIIYNVFGVESATRILFYKTPEENYSCLKTFLQFLSLMPEGIHGIKGNTILSRDIPEDPYVKTTLENLIKNN